MLRKNKAIGLQKEIKQSTLGEEEIRLGYLFCVTWVQLKVSCGQHLISHGYMSPPSWSSYDENCAKKISGVTMYHCRNLELK